MSVGDADPSSPLNDPKPPDAAQPLYQPPPPYQPPPQYQPPPAAPPPPPARGGSRLGLWIAAAAIATVFVLSAEATFIGLVISRSHASQSQGSSRSPIHTVPQQTPPGNVGGSLNVQAIADKVDPAVVDINTVIATAGPSAQAAGTGMILTSNGEILTNHHVVQGATGIKVGIQGHANPYTATVVGVDTTGDVALLQLQNASGLPTVTLADSSTLRVGASVVAIGNALGQGGTPKATQGTVIALDRSITASSGPGRTEQLTGLIQADASISPGDSGGPLVNAAGQVVGMITAGASAGRQSSTNVGYAIPSSTAVKVVNLIRSGQSAPGIVLGLPGYLGVSVRNVDAATASQLGLSGTSGALVTGVGANTPAAQAGIAANSVITAIDGNSIVSADALGPAIQSHKPGQKIQVTWVDSKGRHSADVTLASGPAA